MHSFSFDPPQASNRIQELYIVREGRYCVVLYELYVVHGGRYCVVLYAHIQVSKNTWDYPMSFDQ